MISSSTVKLVSTVRDFCGAVYGAQCLVARGEIGPRVSALMRYASTLLDAIDIQLLETGLAPGANELRIAGRVRERFERVVLLLVTSSLRHRAARAAGQAERAERRARSARAWRKRMAHPESRSAA